MGARDVREIRLVDLSKSYGNVVVFDQVNHSFAGGCVHCILGPSGAGKTTLMRMLMGVEPPTSGRIEGLEGAALSAVFQEDRLCENLSVALNVRLPHPSMAKAEKSEFIQRADRLLCEMDLPCAMHRTVSELSGGMKRRVAIARAVLAPADVLFFDEPLKGLDAQTERHVMRAVVPLLEGKTVFWVTHRKGELEYFTDPQAVDIRSL